MQQSSAQFVGSSRGGLLRPPTRPVSGWPSSPSAPWATILVGILLYIEFAVRAAVIYLALLFLPARSRRLGLAQRGAGGPPAHRPAGHRHPRQVRHRRHPLARRRPLAQSTAGGGFSTFVVGLVILLLAAAAPLALLGLVAHAEHAVAGVAGVRRAAYAPPQQAATHGAARRDHWPVAVAGAAGAGGSPSLTAEPRRRRGAGRRRHRPARCEVGRMSAEYLFGPLERRGVFLGARLGQIVVLLTTTGGWWPFCSAVTLTARRGAGVSPLLAAASPSSFPSRGAPPMNGPRCSLGS